MEKNKQITNLNSEIIRRKTEIVQIKEDVERSLSERADTIKNIQEKLSGQYEERERDHAHKINHLENEIKENVRRIYGLEDQLRRAVDELNEERRIRGELEERLMRTMEENLQLHQRNTIQEEIMKESETKREEILTAIIEEIGSSDNSGYIGGGLDQGVLQDLYARVQASFNQETGSTPYCNETLKELLEELISKGEEYRSVREEEYRLEMKSSKEENRRLMEDLENMKHNLAFANRERDDMRQRIEDEKAVTERIERERKELLESLRSCGHNEVNLREDLELYQRTLDLASQNTQKPPHSGSSSSSSSSDSECNDGHHTARPVKVRVAPGSSSRPPIPTKVSGRQLGSAGRTAGGLVIGGSAGLSRLGMANRRRESKETVEAHSYSTSSTLRRTSNQH